MNHADDLHARIRRWLHSFWETDNLKELSNRVESTDRDRQNLRDPFRRATEGLREALRRWRDPLAILFPLPLECQRLRARFGRIQCQVSQGVACLETVTIGALGTLAVAGALSLFATTALAAHTNTAQNSPILQASGETVAVERPAVKGIREANIATSTSPSETGDPAQATKIDTQIELIRDDDSIETRNGFGIQLNGGNEAGSTTEIWIECDSPSAIKKVLCGTYDAASPHLNSAPIHAE